MQFLLKSENWNGQHFEIFAMEVSHVNDKENKS